MKHIISAALIAVAGLSFTSCNDFLDDNRYPETKIVDNPLYWSNAANCDMQVNRLYQYFYGFSTGTKTDGQFYFNTLSDDQASAINGAFQNWKYPSGVPSSDASYTDPYVVIRGCNYIIKGVESGTLSDREKANYIAQARLIRGYEYYLLVRRYGDVVWAGTWQEGDASTIDPMSPDNVLDPESPELFYPRVDRKKIMDIVYEDVKYATENIIAQSGKQVFSKDMANAMLSDICLFEGTFWKYCTEADNYYAPDATRAALFLNRCVEASQGLIAKYPISADYQALYNSGWKSYGSLSTNAEVIFATEYEESKTMHSTVDYISSSTQIAGISKDAFDAYLFKDGKPLALTSENKTDLGVPVEHLAEADNNGPGLSIANLLEVRDQRLAATIDPYVYYGGMSYARAGAMQATSSSGYGVKKYDNTAMPVDSRDQGGKNFTCAPLYWGAVICLNYAEAKAELGTLSDADINNTLNKLYQRAGLPNQTLASLSNMNDPANNMGVSSLLWEVRRCRRCELIMDRDSRYWDLIRWHKLDLLDNTKHPNIMLGANVSNSLVPAAATTGNYINASQGQNRIFDKRQYQYPIPSGQLTINPNLQQNANWK